MMEPCYIFDIDGTCADLTHRLHWIKDHPHDWNSFFNAAKHDTVFPHIRQLAYTLASATYRAQIVYCSGRPERTRFATAAWLNWNGFPPGKLFMRPDDDFREDSIVKQELLALIRQEFEPLMAFDDRDRVVEMWRRNGVPCAQVADGRF